MPSSKTEPTSWNSLSTELRQEITGYLNLFDANMLSVASQRENAETKTVLILTAKVEGKGSSLFSMGNKVSWRLSSK
jgi:hypothetical protein